MLPKTHAMLMESEEAHMQRVYRQLELDREQTRKDAASSSADVSRGQYDDDVRSILYRLRNRAVSDRDMANRLYTMLYPNPYSGHIEAQINGGEPMHYYLSDQEDLDEPVHIRDPKSKGILLPFKLDKERPVSSALQRCFLSANGKDETYDTHTGSVKDTWVLHPLSITKDTISNRKLLNAIQFYPEAGFTRVTADELLEMKLDENRNNPVLQNIIATLQQKQFQIIEADRNTSFVVQGCAGSGKSQCLLHRLFYLRDELSQDKWNHVLLLTPTQLFRNYSAELVRRYRLSDIQNYSLAELYKELLYAYDPRFKNRQYLFELSEEYLPDQYLHAIYDSALIQRIDSEIETTIAKFVGDGCAALGIDPIVKINAVSIGELVEELDQSIAAYESREQILSQDTEYDATRKEYEQLQKDVQRSQKSLERAQLDQGDCRSNLEKLEQLTFAVKEAKDEIAGFYQARNQKYVAAKKALSDLETALSGRYTPDIPAKYARQLYIVRDLASGTANEADQEYLSFLKEVEADAESALKAHSGDQTPERALSRLRKRYKEQDARIEGLKAQLESETARLEQCTAWLQNKAGEIEGEKSKIALQRTEMDRARYFLSRIESTVFEQVIWNAVLPLKEQHGVKALEISSVDGTRQKETRILYKSDLLFYIRVYARLHSGKNLPDYRLLCIDEGQDLHKADYDTLHKLFPHAVFNVFGDIAQVLHESCGIHDWRAETGIPTLYKLNRNYRNTAAVVDFCNTKFHAGMDSFGTIRREQYPTVIRDVSALSRAILKRNAVVIVRDRQCFAQMCKETGLSPDLFEFLDTTAAKPSGAKTACYSIFAAKGLEFPSVVVYSESMTANQKVVACTRAMEALTYYEC